MPSVEGIDGFGAELLSSGWLGGVAGGVLSGVGVLAPPLFAAGSVGFIREISF